MSVTVRAPGPGDGAGMARVWLSAATVSVPFYEQRMGYQRRSIVFTKPLR